MQTPGPSDSSVPLTQTTNSPPQSSDPKSKPQSNPSTAVPKWSAYLKAQAEHRAKEYPLLKKNPSIERLLGSSHEDFKHSVNSRTRNISSFQGSGAETGRPSDPDSSLMAFSRSTAGSLSTAPDKGGESDHQSSTNAESLESLNVIKTVEMPEFPIRVFKEDPPPFSLEMQRRRMRWRQAWLGNLGLTCVQDPNIDTIQGIVRPFIESIAPEANTFSVTLLARGSFNLAYNIMAENATTGFQRNYIFRASLPIWPYYKVESDVATTEFVRHATSIPVPTIYAFNSNPANKLGFEWMLMDRVQGRPLNDVWDTMEFDSKQSLVRRIANCMAELSQFKFSKIGSIFMRYRQCHVDFYIGPPIHEKLFEQDRLLHKVDRGPFKSVQALYDVILDLAERHVNEAGQRVRPALEDTETRMLDSNNESSSAEMTRGTQSPITDSLKAALAQADAEDKENENEFRMSKNMLSRLPGELQKYRTMLPQLFALLPATKPLITFLVHPDLGEANIFVDDDNTLVALIDWERARLEPTALVDFMPKFLEDGESDIFYVPSRTTVPEVNVDISLYDYDKLAYSRGMYEKSYGWLMSRIQKTRLRTVYRDEMIRLDSPLCDRDPETLEQELMNRVYWPDTPGHTSATYWMAKYLGESVFDESDDDTEQGSEVQSAEDS